MPHSLLSAFSQPFTSPRLGVIIMLPESRIHDLFFLISNYIAALRKGQDTHTHTHTIGSTSELKEKRPHSAVNQSARWGAATDSRFLLHLYNNINAIDLWQDVSHSGSSAFSARLLGFLLAVHRNPTRMCFFFCTSLILWFIFPSNDEYE